MEMNRGTAMSHATIQTGHNRRLIFLRDADYRRHMLGLTPQGYRPTLGQPRYDRAALKATLAVLPGGRAG